MQEKQPVNEKKQVGASYILTFYNNVIALNDVYAQYCNLLAELQAKYGDEFTDKSSDQEKNLFLDVARSLRHLIITSKIQYEVIKNNTGLKVADEEKARYNNLRDTLAPKRPDIEEYIIKLNDFLVSEIIKELLVNSTSIFNTLYGETKEW